MAGVGLLSGCWWLVAVEVPSKVVFMFELSLAWLSPSLFHLFLGSFEMNKLRLAVMGNNGKNLDDLAQMDGKLNI